MKEELCFVFQWHFKQGYKQILQHSITSCESICLDQKLSFSNNCKHIECVQNCLTFYVKRQKQKIKPHFSGSVFGQPFGIHINEKDLLIENLKDS